MKHVFWSGGFDSTYLILKLLEEGETVQPVNIPRSTVTARGMAPAIEKIFPLLRNMYGDKIMDVTYWNADPQNFQNTWDNGSSIGMGRVAIYIRACRDDLGIDGIIGACLDDSMGTTLIARPEVRTFLAGLETPLLHTKKIEMWNNATEYQQEVLKLTWSPWAEYNPHYVTYGVLRT